MLSTSIVYPVAAVAVTLLSFLTSGPTPALVGLFAVALLPWALVAGGVRIPAVVVVLVTLAPTAWAVVRLDDQAALFLAVVAVCWSAAQGLRWQSVIAAGGGIAAAIVRALAHSSSGPMDWMFWATGVLFGWFAGSLLHRQRLLTDELRVTRNELALAAAENERKAIAREVHDVVGHSLMVVLLNIAGARRHLATNPAAADEALARAETVGRDSLETVRSVVGLLHSPAVSERDAPLPDGRDVLPLLEQARRSGLPISVSVDGDPAELEPAIGLAVVRLLQESLANATRHAAGARIDVELHVGRDAVDGSVSNPASATSTTSSPRQRLPDRVGLGLSSMSDRVTTLDGTFDAGAADGRWVVRWNVPRPTSDARRTTTATTTDGGR